MQPLLSASSLNNLAILTDEQREKANKRTAQVLKELDDIRRKLELPVEQLPLVIELHARSVEAIMAEVARADIERHTSRVPFMMRSETHDYKPMKIQRGQVAEVKSCPQFSMFRPEDFEIHGHRDRWRVHDIKVGNRSQVLGRSFMPIPGDQLGPAGVCAHLRLDTVGIGTYFTFMVEYVGPEPDGEVFEVTIVGSARD